jgi:V-type H+-transporting ATPase subunit F
VGFLLGGIGEINKNRQPNFMVVDKSKCNNLQLVSELVINGNGLIIVICNDWADTSVSEVEENFKKFIRRDDIDIILINQNVRMIKES